MSDTFRTAPPIYLIFDIISRNFYYKYVGRAVQMDIPRADLFVAKTFGSGMTSYLIFICKLKNAWECCRVSTPGIFYSQLAPHTRFKIITTSFKWQVY